MGGEGPTPGLPPETPTETPTPVWDKDAAGGGQSEGESEGLTQEELDWNEAHK